MSEVADLLAHIEEELRDIKQSVFTLRDELKLQMHLAKADVKQDWEQLESKYQNYQEKMALIGEEITEENEDIFDIARMLGKELLTRYEKIKTILKS